MAKIVAAVDERLLRAGLWAILEAGPDLTVVGEAADGAETAEVALRQPWSGPESAARSVAISVTAMPAYA